MGSGSGEPPVRLRSGRKSDINAINDLLETHFPWTEYETSFQIDAETFSATGETVVAMVEESFAGVVWWLPSGAFGQSGYIKTIGVHDAFQSTGIGTRLLDEAEASIFDKYDRSDIFLLVSAFNDRAQTFYKRSGYEQVGILSGYVEAGIDEIIMRKSV